MNPTQLCDYIIKPTLTHLNLYSEDSTMLLLGTACAESHCGKYISQVGSDVAKGIYQMETATAEDIIENYLLYRNELYDRVMDLYIKELSFNENLRGNLFFATAMTRIHYYRVPESIPGDLEGQATYWKKYYNTELGAGTVEGYIEKYNKYGR